MLTPSKDSILKGGNLIRLLKNKGAPMGDKKPKDKKKQKKSISEKKADKRAKKERQAAGESAA